MITFFEFQEYPNLHYDFSSRKDGSMHRHLEKENRARYFKAQGINPERVVIADLVHGTNVVRVGEDDAGKMISGADALITNTKNLFLSVTGADCFAVYFYDPETSSLGIAHVGWRGLLGGIIKNVVSAMTKEFGVHPESLQVAIGPGIRKCHYSISQGDVPRYKEYPNFIAEKDSETFVDLAGIIAEQLHKSGIPAKQTEDSRECTYCNSEEYFSYRRDKPKEVEPMVAYIGLGE